MKCPRLCENQSTRTDQSRAELRVSLVSGTGALGPLTCLLPAISGCRQWVALAALHLLPSVVQSGEEAERRASSVCTRFQSCQWHWGFPCQGWLAIHKPPSQGHYLTRKPTKGPTLQGPGATCVAHLRN